MLQLLEEPSPNLERSELGWKQLCWTRAPHGLERFPCRSLHGTSFIILQNCSAQRGGIRGTAEPGGQRGDPGLVVGNVVLQEPRCHPSATLYLSL